MAISFIAESHSPGYGTAYLSSVTCDKPSGTASGDLMIWVVGGSVTGAPSGWTQIGADIDSGTSSQGNVQVYYKIAGSSEPSSYTANFSSSWWSATCSISTYRGVSTSTPIGNFSFGSASGTNYNTGSVTASSGQWAYSFAGDYTFSGSSHSFTEGSGTERVDFGVSTGDPATASFMSCDSNATVATGSFSRTQTCSTSTSGGVKGVILLNQAGGAATSPNAGLVSVTAVAKSATIAPHADPASAAVAAQDAQGVPGKNPAGGLVSIFASAKNADARTGFLVKPGAAQAVATAKTVAYRVFPEVVTASGSVGGIIVFHGTPPWRTNKVPADTRTIVVPKDVRTYIVPADQPVSRTYV